MNELTISEKIEKYIIEEGLFIVYFTGQDCGACEVIKNKVKEIIKTFPKVKFIEVDGEHNPKLTAKYSVFSLPLLILYVDGKESLRISRTFSVNEFTEVLNRYYKLIFD